MEKLILLIDDDGEELEILSEALNVGKINATCLWAEGREHAIRLLGHIKPDFIFIDINMPGMDGLTCLQKLRKKRALSAIPMVMYSTNISDDTKSKAKEIGVTGCIQKTDNIASLVAKLTAFFRVKVMSE